MTRRKSVCSKWTLVLLVVVSCQFVHSRPQEVSSPVSTPPNNVQTTENPQRYRFRSNEQLARFKSPIVISFVNNSFFDAKSPDSKNKTNLTFYSTTAKNAQDPFYYLNPKTFTNTRKSRLITSQIKINDPRKKHESVSSSTKNKRNKVKVANFKNNLQVSEPPPMTLKKAPIRKIVTKWTDKAKYEDLDFNSETTASNEIMSSFGNYAPDASTDLNNDISTDAAVKGNKLQNLNKLYNKLVNNRYKPKPEYSEETQVYSSNVQIVDRYPYPSSRPTYVFSTPMPTPIITNVGNPQPWQQPSFQNVYRKTTKRPVQTKRPIKNQYDYQNSVHNNVQYPYHNFEVTTFPPSTGYTDKIVIRPEEYAASPDECPTIFLTLNNTFQGQGKEACPDLNIAVNTNVVNKNVVVESDEEETETLFPNAFGDIDDSEAESTQVNDFFESEEDEEQGDSASIESTELTNYNAANEEILSDSPEAGGFGSPSTNLASYHKPSKPGSDLDDLFTFSGFIDFFRPSLSALSWLVSLNPFNFGLLSFFFSPIAMIFAAAYGVASFFSRLPLAREAPKVIHVFQPQWQWDNEIKAWHLNSFPVDRDYKYRMAKNSNEENAIKPTLFFKIKEWMKAKTKELRENNNKKMMQNNRRSKRKKREAWTRRVK